MLGGVAVAPAACARGWRLELDRASASTSSAACLALVRSSPSWLGPFGSCGGMTPGDGLPPTVTFIGVISSSPSFIVGEVLAPARLVAGQDRPAGGGDEHLETLLDLPLELRRQSNSK